MQRDGKPARWLHNFSLVYDLPARVDVPSVKDSFQHAFEAIRRGEAETDAFNLLVLGARLAWREVTLLRALACYLRQNQFSFTDDSIARALANNTTITRNVVALFKAKFDPRLSHKASDNDGRAERLHSKSIADVV